MIRTLIIPILDWVTCIPSPLDTISRGVAKIPAHIPGIIIHHVHLSLIIDTLNIIQGQTSYFLYGY